MIVAAVGVVGWSGGLIGGGGVRGLVVGGRLGWEGPGLNRHCGNSKCIIIRRSELDPQGWLFISDISDSGLRQ